ncbi:ras-related protein Rab-7L1-like isoform X1 [Arapaima gigas]
MPLDYLFKILVLGQSKVGKTSFVQRYVRGVYNEGYKVTIGVDFAMRTVQWSGGQTVRLQFWDIQGQEDTLPLSRAFFRNAHGCIVMCDVTNAESLQYCVSLKHAVDSENVIQDGPPIPCVLVGNKCDLPNRTISEQDMDDLSSSTNCIAWKNTSVKKNKNIEEAVWCILQAIMERQPEEQPPPSRMDVQHGTLKLDHEAAQSQQMLLRSCCNLGT